MKVTKLATNNLEQDEQDDAETPVVAGKEAEKDATNDATNGATTDEELLLQASLEEQEEALVWLDGLLKEQKVSWSKVYRVCEALGMPHPVGGASRQEMANFALSVRMDREVRKALEESGITGIAMEEPKSPAKASRTAKKTVKTILDADKEEVTSDEATDLFAKKLPENVVM